MTKKRKTTHIGNGEEDSQAQIGKELSKGTLAQRARRERERILKQMLGGDFRQILPVVPKGVHEEIVNASLRCSDLWDDICVLTLNLNMRLNTTDPANAVFADFLMEVGTNPREVMQLPSTIGRCQNLNELLLRVYPQLDVTNTSTPTFLTERTILFARNDDVNAINGTALNIFSGK
ncbi:uncharacterized protein LOC131317142 [Rhododendron vialii]|uniref:uncharacterized protein LOC131317142 n=1 Tax=Rhododendron vialii TaxID=182163 RepID=UPI00265DA23E|nr:uncharacterized protein LOC131317142 [Rhododendron vialii]